jgi:hypothetical protein
MREIAIVFICIAGLMVIGSWALTITLAVKSGKGIYGIFSRPRKQQWLSAADTIVQYNGDITNIID